MNPEVQETDSVVIDAGGKMLKAIIVGASGYTGAELVRYILRHPHIQLQGLYVSEQSLDAGKPISTLHGQLAGLSDLLLQPLSGD